MAKGSNPNGQEFSPEENIQLAHQIRQNDLLTAEEKEAIFQLLKEKRGYKKDEEGAKTKRERRAKIQNLAGGDPEKVRQLQAVLHDEKKETSEYATSLSQYPDHFQKVVAETDALDEEFVLREIKFNPVKNEYVRIETGLAIMAEDLKPDTLAGAKSQLQGTEYYLPKDVNWKKAGVERLGLYPEQSDFDKMIARLPGTDSQAKGILFGQLMCMRGRYWTGTPYRLDDNGNPTDIVSRRFDDAGRVCGWFGVDDVLGYVRGVRSL